MRIKESLLFLHRFFGHPKRVGSVAPSSRFLAARMMEPIPWEQVQAVAELGSGTGAITRAIQANADSSTRILLFEMDKRMREYLKIQYPSFTCHTNARHLTVKMKQDHIDQLDVVVSGLPFFNFTPDNREFLINQVLEALKPGGLFITYQYSLQMKRILADKFIIEEIKYVPFNIPPAFVYVCRKKE